MKKLLVFCHLLAVSWWSVSTCPAATIKGVVTDSLTNEVVAAAVVKIKGTTDSALTDTAGRFTLNTTTGIGRAVSSMSEKIPSNVLVTVYRPDGTILLSGRVPELSALPDGIYLLAYREAGSTRAGKLVKFGTQYQTGPQQAGKAAANVTLAFTQKHYRLKELTAAEGDTGVRARLDQKKGWELDATTTGLAGVNINKNSLPVQSGPIAAGSKISLKKLTDPDVSAGNITLDRCWIICTSNPTSLQGVGNGTLTIKDCIIQGDVTNTAYACAVQSGTGDQAVTLLRCDISGFGGGFWFDGPGTAQQNYIHDLPAVGNPATTGNHVDGMTRRAGTGQLNIINNCIDIRACANATSAIMIQDTWADFIDNVLLQGNLLGGGGWVVYCNQRHTTFGVHFTSNNNRFFPNPPYGNHCDDITNGGSGPIWKTWTNNYVNDPAKTDNKGAVVN